MHVKVIQTQSYLNRKKKCESKLECLNENEKKNHESRQIASVLYVSRPSS